MATIKLVKSDMLTEVIKSSRKKAIAQMITEKEKAFANATANADYYRSVGNDEFADNEQQRADRLARDIEKLNMNL